MRRDVGALGVVLSVAIAACGPSEQTVGLFCDGCTSALAEDGTGGDAGAGGNASTSSSGPGTGGASSTSGSAGGDGVGGAGGLGSGGAAPGAGGGPIVSAPVRVYTTTDHPRHVACDGTSIYWTEIESGAMKRAGLDGSNVETVVADGMTYAIATRDSGNDVVVAISGPDGRILRVSKASGNVSLIAAAPGARAFDMFDGVPYWADESAIRAPDRVVVVDAGRPSSVEVDASGVYWASAETAEIRTANIDGSSISAVAPTGGHVQPSAMAIAARNLYWGTASGLHSLALAGGTVDSVAASVSCLIAAGDLVVWLNEAAGAEKVMLSDPGSGTVTELGDGNEIESFSHCNGLLFWTDYWGEIWSVRIG